MTTALALSGVSKSFETPAGTLQILSEIQFSVPADTVASIVGPSGSGKTTLLGLCAGLDTPTKGQIEVLGSQVHSMSEDEKATFRAHNVGFVFQNFELIPTLTALENIQLPMEIAGQKEVVSRAKTLLEAVGLKDRGTHYPSELSGGEQQRIAIARAFANQPRILFADEPTGNLDGETGSSVENLLFELNQRFGTTLIIVTHNMQLAARTAMMVRLRGGKIEATATPQVR
ncbi:MAG: ABC transporter ATP-binding protein [Flavobacteriales bacterium]|nr:ABC transporter ATP-binding protein [Flavobacteriales bacterium]